MNQLFARKPLEALLEEMEGEHRLRRDPRPGPAHQPRGRRDHRRRHLRRHRRRRAQRRRPGADALVRGRRHHLHLRRALLRRVRVDGAGRRLRVHLRLRDARRAVRLDHRLGPRARVRGRQRHGRDRLVAATSRTSSRKIGIHLPEAAPRVPLALRRRRGRLRAHRLHRQPSRGRHRPDRHGDPGQGHPGERLVQRRDGGDQGRRGALRDRRRRLLHRTRPTGSRSRRTAGRA